MGKTSASHALNHKIRSLQRNLAPDLREADVTSDLTCIVRTELGVGDTLAIFPSVPLSLRSSVRHSPKHLDVLTSFTSHKLLCFKVDAMLSFPSGG